MKKSFLKRLTAAIVAVPVAMTQTVLFTSFAAGETTSSDTLDVQSVFNINTNTAKLVAASAFKSAAETRFNAKELGYENAYVQDSAWNEKVISVLNSRDGNSYNISAESLADSIEGAERAHQVLRDALGDKNTKATAYVTDKAVEIVAEFDYDYAEALKLQIEDMVRDFDLNIQKNELAKINNLKGTVTVTLDITDLKNKSVNVVADVDINGKKKGIKDVENYIDDLHEELIGALASDATASVDTDAKKTRVLSAVVAADKAYHLYKDKVDNVDGVVDWTTSKPLADADSVLAELKTKWKKAPGSLAAIQNNRWFNRCDKILSALVDEINKQDGKKTVSVTMSDLVDMAKKGSDFQAYVHADAYNYVGQGEVLFYVTDEDFTAADQAQVKTFFESQKEIADALAEKNEVIDNVYSVKVVEADAALNGLSDEDAVTTAAANGSMDVYRIVWFDTKPNETDTKAETPTATDQVETPTGTDPVETPTATDQVETPTATDQVETPTATDQVETPTATDQVETPTATDQVETPTATDPVETPTATDQVETPTATDEQPETPTNPPESDTTPKTVEGEVDMNVTVNNAGAGVKFFFSHDTRAFDMTKIVAAGATSNESKEAIDYAKFTLGSFGATLNGIEDYGKDFSPAKAFANAGQTYVAAQFTLLYDGKTVVTGREHDANGEITKDGTPVRVTIYIGVKGDLNLDGLSDSRDGTLALIHAAQVGTGIENARKFTDFSDVKEILPASEVLAADMENFVIFLGDIDTETTTGEDIANEIKVDAKDATSIFQYAARRGVDAFGTRWINDAGVTVKDEAGNDYTFARKGIITSNYPEYSKAIAVNDGLLKEVAE